MSILVIGRSHTACVKKAADKAGDRHVRVININRDGEPDPADLQRDHEAHPPVVLGLSFDGNMHNVLCLGEHPQPFTIAGAGGPEGGRTSIPHAVMRDLFRMRIEGRMTEFVTRYRTCFPEARLVVILPPPPLADLSRIETLSDVLAARVAGGFAPAEIRLAAYECQLEIYRDVAREAGVGCLEPPPAARDDSGLLAPDYTSKDPTHGNEAYGALVLSQLEECMNG